MNTYHVTYYYLATGMEGRADTADHGYWEANSAQEAIEKCGKAKYPWSDSRTQTWGLSAQLIRQDSSVGRAVD